MRRILLTIAALLVPVGALSVGVSGVAGAASGKIKCTTITGNASTTVVVSGCTGGNTGSSTDALPVTTLAGGGTVTWTSGSTTTSGSPTLTTLSATHCPGYVKNAMTNPIAEGFSSTVTADTGNGMALPATETGSVCVGTDGTITALKSLEIVYVLNPTIVCTAFGGNVAGNTTVSGCTGGNTGGGSSPFPGASLATGGTVPWLSGGSVTLGAPTLTATSATHCPGYVKNAETNPIAYKIAATITADTGDGLKLPGSAKGAVCIGTDGTLSAIPGKTLSIK